MSSPQLVSLVIVITSVVKGLCLSKVLAHPNTEKKTKAPGPSDQLFNIRAAPRVAQEQTSLLENKVAQRSTRSPQQGHLSAERRRPVDELDGLAEEDIIFVVHPFILDIAEEFILILVDTINAVPGIADVKTATSVQVFTFCVF